MNRLDEHGRAKSYADCVWYLSKIGDCGNFLYIKEAKLIHTCGGFLAKNSCSGMRLSSPLALFEAGPSSISSTAMTGGGAATTAGGGGPGCPKGTKLAPDPAMGGGALGCGIPGIPLNPPIGAS